MSALNDLHRSLTDAPAGKLRRLDLARMVAEKPPDVPYRVDPVLVDGALTMLFGQPGEGKSLLAAVLGNAVAHGDTVAGLAAQRGRVLYIDAENGRWEIHRRVHTLGLVGGNLDVYEADGFDLRSDIAELERLIHEDRPRLVVLDSLASLAPGFRENEPEHTGPVLDRLRRVAHRTGVAVLLIHHSRKDGDTYRGNTGILAAVDAAFRLGRDKDDPDRSRRFLVCHKMRVAPEPSRRWLRLTVDDGQVFVDEADAHGEQETPPSTPAQAELRPRVLAALGSQPLSRKAVARAVGRSEDDQSVRRVLRALAAANLAERTDSGWITRGSGGPAPIGPDPLTPLAANGEVATIARWTCDQCGALLEVEDGDELRCLNGHRVRAAA